MAIILWVSHLYSYISSRFSDWQKSEILACLQSKKMAYPFNPFYQSCLLGNSYFLCVYKTRGYSFGRWLSR